MSSENFDSKQELVPGEEKTEGYELDPSSKEVVGIIAEDAARIEADGQEGFQALSEGLPENDPGVVSAWEQLSNITKRAKELTKWAGAALALSLAQSDAPREVDASNVEVSRPKEGDPYVLKYESFQRSGYTTIEGYDAYLTKAWDTYQQSRSIERENWQDSNARLTFEALNRAGSLSDTEVLTQSTEFKGAIKNFDEQREWLADVTHSYEYERRLKNEGLDGTDLNNRRQRVVEDTLRVEDPLYSISGNLGILGVTYDDSIKNYPHVRGKSIVRKEEASDPQSTIALHEHQHKVTEGKRDLSLKAKQLYGKAFSPDKINPELRSQEGYVEYMSDPTEIDARKKQFEYELEKLTDWQYGDPFTEEQVLQVKKLQQEGKFTRGATEFIELIKGEYFIEIMNTLAQNESDQGHGEESRVERA